MRLPGLCVVNVLAREFIFAAPGYEGHGSPQGFWHALGALGIAGIVFLVVILVLAILIWSRGGGRGERMGR